jgi:hypothetical protein
MTAKNTSDTRRFRFSLALSLVLNAGLLLLAGWRALPDRPAQPQARPHIHLVTLARTPAPPASARRGLAAARALTHRQTPQARSRPTQAHPTALPRTRVKPVPTQPAPQSVEVQEPEAPPAPPVFKIVAADIPSALVVPRLHVPAPLPRAVQANPLPLTPSPAAPTHQPTPVHQPTPAHATPAPASPPAPAAATPAPAAAAPGGEEAGRGEPAGEGVGLTGGAGIEANQKAGGPFGIGDGLKSSGKVRHIVYVLDISGSMGSRIDRADDELRGAMRGLRPGETFNIVAFSGGSVLFDPDMAEATPWMVQRASIFLDTLKIGGGTNLGDAVARALMLRDVNEVVVMTDGVPTAGELDFRRLAQVIRQFNTRHARISTVGMVGRNPDNTDNSFEAAGLLREIADDSGGASKLVTVGSSNP